jgi:hypothetical protein
MNKAQDDLPIWYQVNAENVIVLVSNNWDLSVLRQSTPNLLSKAIIGKPLSVFISGDVARMFTQTMIDSARIRNQELVRNCRCDTPTHKREMQMILTPLQDYSVRVTHKLVSAIAWKHPRSMSVNCQVIKKIKRCSMCNNLFDGHNWLTQDDFLAAYPEFDRDKITVFYGICSSCGKRKSSR